MGKKNENNIGYFSGIGRIDWIGLVDQVAYSAMAKEICLSVECGSIIPERAVGETNHLLLFFLHIYHILPALSCLI